jgi:hypothetical protein
MLFRERRTTQERLYQQAVILPRKHLVLAPVFATLFGPLGLFYATVPGAMVALIIGIGLAAYTFGLVIFLVWPLSAIWAALVVTSSNKKGRLASAVKYKG